VAVSFVLPEAGTGSEAEEAGYLYKDAYRRDLNAWRLAHTEGSFWEQLRDRDYSSDQYGGMLGMSAVAYRLFSPDDHRPWLIILIGALTYGLGAALAFRAILTLWGGPDGLTAPGPALAGFAGWVLALYPESIMHGASQMREPFLAAFLCMAFWGFVSLRGSKRSGWFWLAGGMLGMLLFSPGVAVVALVALGIWTWLRGEQRRFSGKSAVLVLVVLVAALTLLWLALARGPLEGGSPLAVVNLWLGWSVNVDLDNLVRQSGWLQSIFSILPEQYHLPFVTLTGLIQPILPGTITDPTAWPWQALNILRSAGWYALVPFIGFGLVAAWKSPAGNERRGWLWLWLVCVGWIVFASLRAAGDQWDNPRYRSLLLLIQALLAAYAFVRWRESKNPWMVRILWMEAVFVGLFTYWYVMRAIGWAPGQVHVFVIVAAILAVCLLILVGGWILDWRRSRRRAREQSAAGRAGRRGV
jgi:4-amino-4-deoxy-L-arabinose transferase-like glycosyltransferase